jgi:predicted nucleic acid-binding protein
MGSLADILFAFGIPCVIRGPHAYPDAGAAEQFAEPNRDGRSEQAARDVEALLRRFEIVSMAGNAIAVTSARNFRLLRRRGITVRKTIDLLIGTWCIENRVSLLHNDSDFHPMT